MADAEPDFRLKIDGTVYELGSLDDLSLDESGLIEDLVGKPIEMMAPGDFALKKVVKAFAYIFISRENPAFTFADAGRLKLSAFEDAAEDRVPAEPGKGKAGKSAGKGRTAKTRGASGSRG